MPNYLVLMPNPFKACSFEQTIFAINAHNFGSLEGGIRFILGVTSSGTCFRLNDYRAGHVGPTGHNRYHKYPTNDINILSAEANEITLPVSPYMSQAGWFVLYIPGTRIGTWQKDLVQLLQTVCRNTGEEYYEPIFGDGTIEPAEHLNVLTLAEYPYECSGGGSQISEEEREAAAEELTDTDTAKAIPYTYVPSPYAVSSPLELLAAIGQLCQDKKCDSYATYKHFEGVVGKNGVLYKLELISSCYSNNPKMLIPDEQYKDITVTLPLAPDSSPHTWLVFRGAPQAALPTIQAIHTDLLVSGKFEPASSQESSSIRTDIAIYDPSNAIYKAYKTLRRDIPIHFYIPTAPTQYNHILLKGPAAIKTLVLSDFTDLDTEEHESQRALYKSKREEEYEDSADH